ncbi:hypothetical protein [Nocardia sp. NPDC024068]|uniref:hypothetical protein n=1 Tax=Nocardia sp. NPDC024068 TaxID=3157197 RepID=UPI0033C9E83A
MTDRDTALAGLAMMIGEWDVTSPQFPGETGHTSIEWLNDHSFLMVVTTLPGAHADRAWVVGADEGAEHSLAILQHGRDGSRRIYHGFFDGPLWRVWRDAPGGSQRFTGTLDETGNVFRATWERSDAQSDPRDWEHEFDLTYTRIS